MTSKMNLVLVLVVVAGLSLSMAAEKVKNVKKNHILYNTTAVLLQVSDSIELSVWNNKTTLFGTALLPNNSGVATGDATETKNTLTLNFTDDIDVKNMSGSTKGKINNVVLKIVTTFNSSIGYWKISDMTVSYKGDKTATDESLWVDKVPGFLPKEGPWNCQRGFTSCAPKTLSWTCGNQIFASKALDEANKQGTKLMFPRMEIQPLYGNGTKIRFGYNWDCDPLISSALWVTLLLGLALIFALYWSCDMITSLNTPDKFDDAKKTKPIMVPTSD